MRVMVMVKATVESEAGKLPTSQLFTDMLNYNEQLVKAGTVRRDDSVVLFNTGAGWLYR